MQHYLLYFLALFGLSQSANLVKFAQAPIEMLGFWRLFFCTILFLPFALQKEDFRSYFSPKYRQELGWTLVSGIFFFLHLWTFFYASKNTSIANCMIIFSINPLFTAIGAYFFFKEKITLRLGLAYAFAFLGIYLLVSQSLNFEQGFVKGDLMALLSGALVSVYLLSGKRVRHRISNTSYSVVLYGTTTLCFGLLTAGTQTPFFSDNGEVWLAIAGLVILPTFLGHSLFMYLVKFMNINLMTCGKLIEPVMSSAMAYWLFSERINFTTVLAFFATSASLLTLLGPEIWKSYHSKNKVESTT